MVNRFSVQGASTTGAKLVPVPPSCTFDTLLVGGRKPPIQLASVVQLLSTPLAPFHATCALAEQGASTDASTSTSAFF